MKNNNFNYAKDAKKTLKSMFKLYDALLADMMVCSRSDVVLDSLNSAIFHVAVSICPPDCYSIDDIREWVMG